MVVCFSHRFGGGVFWRGLYALGYIQGFRRWALQGLGGLGPWGSRVLRFWGWGEGRVCCRTGRRLRLVMGFSM